MNSVMVPLHRTRQHRTRLLLHIVELTAPRHLAGHTNYVSYKIRVNWLGRHVKVLQKMKTPSTHLLVMLLADKFSLPPTRAQLAPWR